MERGVIRAKIRGCMAGILAALLHAIPASANNNGSKNDARVLQAHQVVEGAIRLDGLLGEQVWQQTEFATGFTQREPRDGLPATERTEVRVLYSAEALYIGVSAYDSEPSGIRAELSRRDRVSQSDEITIFLDSYYDRRTAFEFTVNPSGSIRDVYYFDDSDNSSDASWDPVWEVQAVTFDQGWSTEFRIPFTQLRFESENTVWGFQIRRRIYRKAEEVWWAPYSKEANGFVSLFGRLEGLRNLSSPKRVEIRPYSVLKNRYRPESSGSIFNPRRQLGFNGGLDLKYGITSDFTLDLTMNPDFGQVEADPSVVNLSAFETFFPEKRPFFVEGSGLFSSRFPLGWLFYSRRIGRPPQGFATPPPGGTIEIPDATTIISAAKITGKSAGGLGIGVMSALTAEESASVRDAAGARIGSETVEPLTHYFAGKIEQDYDRGSHTVGVFLTAANRRLTDNLNFLRRATYALEFDGSHRWNNNMYALRWQVAGTHLRGSRRAITDAQRSSLHYFQRPDAPDVEVDTNRTTLSGYSLKLHGGKEAGKWQYGIAYEHVSPGFDVSDLGFQRGVAGIHWSGLGVKFLQTQSQWIFRDFSLNLNFENQWSTSGDLTYNWLRPMYLSATFENNWNLQLNPIAIGNWAAFSMAALRGGPALREDTWWNSWIELETDRRKSLAFRLGLFRGGVFSTRGSWYGGNSIVYVRPSETFNFQLGLVYEWDRNPTQWVGKFDVHASPRYVVAEIKRKTLRLTSRVNWILSPDLSVEFYAQPFVSSGDYSRYKEVVAPRAQRFDDRFHSYGEKVVCSSDGMCEVDRNHDGVSDFSFRDPDFNFRQLRSTLVIRWEYRPGSVLFFAWQHGRQRSIQTGAFGGFSDLAHLFSEDSDNTFLIKLNYWFSL